MKTSNASPTTFEFLVSEGADAVLELSERTKIVVQTTPNKRSGVDVLGWHRASPTYSRPQDRALGVDFSKLQISKVQPGERPNWQLASFPRPDKALKI
jgi:hypothetical protein